MVKHSSKSRQVEARREKDDNESSGDESTPPLAQPHRSSSGGKAESVVEVSRKAKRKRSSRGSNKQRPINFMPDIIRMYASSSMDDVRSDCALKSSGSAFLNEFAAHRLSVLKDNMDRTIMSRKQDTMSVQDMISHAELSTYGDPAMRKRAIRFIKKAVTRLEESLTKDEYKKYLEDKKAGKNVVWDKRSRSEKAQAKKKAKEAAKAAAAQEEDGPQPMDESDNEEKEAQAASPGKSKKNKKSAAKEKKPTTKKKAAASDDEEEEEDAPAKHLRSKNAKKASDASQKDADAAESDEDKEKKSDEEDDADADDGTDTANPNPSDSAAAADADEDLEEAGASNGSDEEDDEAEEAENEEGGGD